MVPQSENLAWLERAAATAKAHACDILRNSLNQIECMHTFALEIIYSNYLKKCMSKHPYQYLFYAFLTSTAANSPKACFAFSVGVKPNISAGWERTCQREAEAGPGLNLMS